MLLLIITRQKLIIQKQEIRKQVLGINILNKDMSKI